MRGNDGSMALNNGASPGLVAVPLRCSTGSGLRLRKVCFKFSEDIERKVLGDLCDSCLNIGAGGIDVLY